MPFPRWLAGMRITADRLDDRNIMVVDQGEDQTVTSSTVLVDTNMIIPGEAGAKYWYQAKISYSATVTPDFRWAWSVPSGANVRRFTISREEAAAAGLNTGVGIIMRTPATGTETRAGGGSADGVSPPDFFHVYDEGVIEMGGTAGNVTLQFAQFTSNANETIFRGQSRLIYARVG